MIPSGTHTSRNVRELAARFARENMAGRRELNHLAGMPGDLWKALGASGLLGAGIPGDYDGLGGGYEAVLDAGRELVREGGNMGVAASFLIHNAVARFVIWRLGSLEQKKTFLPLLAKGKITASLAVSEPGTGAHPRHMKTLAAEDGDFFILNGEKAYLTNGPIADLFVVIAVTGEDEGKKSFSAFLVPAAAKGLEKQPPMELDFLRPSPHGGIRLIDCRAPASSLIGPRDQAFPEIVKPFRDVEDVLMMGPGLGAMRVQLRLVTEIMRSKACQPTRDMEESLGLVQSLIHAMDILASRGGRALDDEEDYDEARLLAIAYRSIFTDAQSLVNRLLGESSLEKESELFQITRDIRKSGEIAKNVSRMQMRKLGQSLLERGGGGKSG